MNYSQMNVTVKPNGASGYEPVCDQAKLLAKFKNRDLFQPRDIVLIEEMGFRIIFQEKQS